MALTCPRFNRVTIPLRLYHTPSLVRQTSSASIFPPLVNIITGLLPCRVPIPGPLVETGSLLARECAAIGEPLAEAFEDGEGDGEGETAGEGSGVVVGCGVGTVTGVLDVCGAAAAFCV
jgi:hypothetical protein